MTLKFVKPFFASLLDPHINTKPTLGSKFVDWNKIEESEINILLGAECAINKILQIAGEINNLSSSKPQPPPPPHSNGMGVPYLYENKYVLLYPANITRYSNAGAMLLHRLRAL